MSLQENLGRKDLDWLEIARGYKALQEEGLIHEQIADLVGVDRATVTHRLRLLKLPEEVKNVGRPTFSEAHALALLQLETPEEQLEAFRVWQNSPVTSKSFRKIVKRAKSGLPARGEVKNVRRLTFLYSPLPRERGMGEGLSSVALAEEDKGEGGIFEYCHQLPKKGQKVGAPQLLGYFVPGGGKKG